MKPKILFFSRSFFSKFFSEIKTDLFDDFHVALTLDEKKFLESKGKIVCGCFEEEFERITPVQVPENYLKSSFSSDRFLIRFDYFKRVEILGKEIAFWRSIIETIKPNYIVNETVAIEISEVLALEAERLNIQILNSLCSVFSNSFYWKPDPFLGSVQDLSSLQASEENLIKAKQYFANIVESNYKPPYVQGLPSAKRFSLKRLAGSIFRDSLLFFTKTRLQNSRRFKYEDNYSFTSFQNTGRLINRMFFNYNNLAAFKEHKIIFYPMHYEPEATLFHFAEEYQSQVHNIEVIARSMKINQFLAIKEHPQQKGALLDKRYRLLKRRYPNLIFIPAETPSHEVIKLSEAVVTITSTAAWEAIVYGKPVFVLGSIFFDQCPGVQKVSSYKHLKELLRAENYQLPEKEKVIDFIARMNSILNDGYPSPYYKGDFSENVRMFTLAIEKVIKCQ